VIFDLHALYKTCKYARQSANGAEYNSQGQRGIETRSPYVEFTMMTPSEVRLRWYDGQYSQEFEAGKSMKLSELVLLPTADHGEVGHEENSAGSLKISRTVAEKERLFS